MTDELDRLADRGGRIEDRLGDDSNEPPSGHYRQTPWDSTFRKISEPEASDRMQWKLGTRFGRRCWISGASVAPEE